MKHGRIETHARDALRRGTHDLHERVDAVYSHYRLDDAADYAAFLQGHATAFVACEAALDDAGAVRVLPDWPARRRADLLRTDLADLRVSFAATAGSPVFTSDAAILGGVYVLEGSRLGGAMLVRSVPAHFPRRFLGAAVPGAWRSLIQGIDARLVSREDVGDAVAAARAVFELFEHAGRVNMKA